MARYKEYIDIDGSKLRLYSSKDNKRYYNSNNKLHRLDGPALITKFTDSDYESYYFDGLLHRLDGPARHDGNEFNYCLYGRIYSNYNKLLSILNLTQKMVDILAPNYVANNLSAKPLIDIIKQVVR